MRTKERIKQKALDLFNRQGIEYVGMRELAANLDMQIGNITYYFPTKDDLVNHLALELSALNEGTVDRSDRITLLAFLEMQENIFRNQWDYRCLFLSFVHLIKQNPIIRKRYQQVGRTRQDHMIAHLKTLEKNNYLHLGSPKHLQSLAATASLIARFWISDAVLKPNALPSAQLIRQYSSLIAELLIPYATQSGAGQIEEFLNSSYIRTST